MKRAKVLGRTGARRARGTVRMKGRSARARVQREMPMGLATPPASRASPSKPPRLSQPQAGQAGASESKPQEVAWRADVRTEQDAPGVDKAGWCGWGSKEAGGQATLLCRRPARGWPLARRPVSPRAQPAGARRERIDENPGQPPPSRRCCLLVRHDGLNGPDV